MPFHKQYKATFDANKEATSFSAYLLSANKRK